MVVLASVLLVVQLLLAASARSLAFGLPWAAGARDTMPGTVPLWGARLDRAFHNMLETFPIFAVLAIAAVVAGVNDTTTATGALVYLFARIAYVPAYLQPISYVRSIVWLAAMVGIAMVGWPILLVGLS
ncbi:MAG: MAPEG family protein [Pseudomonadota bacterium]